MREKLFQLLSELKLAGMAGILDEELDRSTAQQLACEDVLYRLLCAESSHQLRRAFNRRARVPDSQPGTGQRLLQVDGDALQSQVDHHYNELVMRCSA